MPKSTYDDRRSTKLLVRVGIAIVALACSIGVFFLLRGCHDRSPSYVSAPRIEQNTYDILVEDWNRSVVNAGLDKSFYLPDANPEGVISKLNSLVTSFHTCNNPELKTELAAIIKESRYSFFAFYGEFLNSHCVSGELSFTLTHRSDYIRQVVSDLTKQDRINTKALTIIASMNDPCLYFDAFHEALYERGMSRNIQSCKDIIIDKSKYPVLFNLVFKKR